MAEKRVFEVTPEEVREIDEIHRDERAIEETLKIALTYASNMRSKLEEASRSWWDKVLGARGVCRDDYFIFTRENGRCVIREATEEEARDVYKK